MKNSQKWIAKYRSDQVKIRMLSGYKNKSNNYFSSHKTIVKLRSSKVQTHFRPTSRSIQFHLPAPLHATVMMRIFAEHLVEELNVRRELLRAIERKYLDYWRRFNTQFFFEEPARGVAECAGQK